MSYTTVTQEEFASFDDYNVWTNSFLIISNKSGLSFEKKLKIKSISGNFSLSSVDPSVLEKMKNEVFSLNKGYNVEKLKDVFFSFEKLTLKNKIKKRLIQLVNLLQK